MGQGWDCSGVSNQSPIHIHYCHGLESGPNGYKATAMREWARVTAPDQKMSLWSPRRRNSVLRCLLRQLPARPKLDIAVSDALEACVQVHRRTLVDQPDVLVGSSWGGLVAAVLIAEEVWTGPAVLLCPALRTMERRFPSLGVGTRSASHLIETLAELPEGVRSRMCIVHGTLDPTVPLADSRELSSRTGIRLEEIEGGSHGLGVIVEDGRLRRLVEAVTL